MRSSGMRRCSDSRPGCTTDHAGIVCHPTLTTTFKRSLSDHKKSFRCSAVCTPLQIKFPRGLLLPLHVYYTAFHITGMREICGASVISYFDPDSKGT